MRLIHTRQKKFVNKKATNPNQVTMLLKFLLLFTLLYAVSSDRLRFHLENLLDRNVSACDDFYHHVCSQKVDPKEFFLYRASSIFDEAINRTHSDAIKSSPIEYDMQLTKNDTIAFENNNYTALVRARQDNLDCYTAELKFYATQMIVLDISFQPEFDEDDDDAPSEQRIEIVIRENLKIIQSLVEYIDTFSKLEESMLKDAIQFHTVIHGRMRIIEFMKTNKTYGDMHEVKEIAKILKSKMIKNIESTAWLRGDEISNFIREKIKERIASIEVFHDFDENDKNITIMQKLNRDLNDAYFSVKSDTGLRRLDVLLRLNYAYANILRESSEEIQSFIKRINRNFELNAFFEDETKTVNMLAPFMNRNAFHSDILKEPIITYFFLGHELYHSLFSPGIPVLLELFSSRTKCITDHYSKSCSKYAMGACASGKQTLTEDGPDLESLRILHSFLRDNYSPDKLNANIEGLETTLEQAFFYYFASGWCAEDEKRSEEKAKDEHSALNIRVNAALSLMPEFTRTFGCQKGEAMFVEEKDSCYVFGPNS